MLLLGAGNVDQFIKGFISLAMTQGGLKYYIENKGDCNYIVKKELECFIEYYINMITLFAVKHLANLTDNKEIFEETLNKAFDANNRKNILMM